jgi:hypothetical protein
VSDIASTVAVLSSSFRSAISPTIFQEASSTILVQLIETLTFQFLIIYHFQLDSAHCIIIISQAAKFSSSQLRIIESTVSLSIHLKIAKLYIVSVIFMFLFK